MLSSNYLVCDEKWNVIFDCDLVFYPEFDIRQHGGHVFSVWSTSAFIKICCASVHHCLWCLLLEKFLDFSFFVGENNSYLLPILLFYTLFILLWIWISSYGSCGSVMDFYFLGTSFIHHFSCHFPNFIFW